MAQAQARTFNFHADPGHGWLEVPIELVRELGIADKISRFSYVSRDQKIAYLEEDCDAHRFVQAAENAGMRVTPNYMHSNRDSFIRNLPSWVALPPLTLTGSNRTADANPAQTALF